MSVQPLRIAHLVPYSINFPLSKHNGRYDWVIDLVIRQAASGLQITVYSNPASHIDIPGVTWKSVPGAFTDSAIANRKLVLLALKDNSIDVYHSHFDNLHYMIAEATKKPIIYTQHWWPTEETIAKAQAYKGKNVWAVPPTKYMFKCDQRYSIQTKGFIYHGINLKEYRYLGGPKSERLLFVGRISPEKNLPIAIAAAQKAQLPLDIIGKVAIKNEHYWQQILPTIDGKQISYLGEKSITELLHFYNQARAVIFPSDINEPFGLVAIEAQACGTPIIMVQGGSRGELLSEGKTGYLCNSVDEFAEAAVMASTIDPEDCVAFVKKFNVTNMTSAYLHLYCELLT